MADYVIAGGTVLFLILALFPWWNYGDKFFGISYSLSGFDSGLVSSAFVLFLLATAWARSPRSTTSGWASRAPGSPSAWRPGPPAHPVRLVRHLRRRVLHLGVARLRHGGGDPAVRRLHAAAGAAQPAGAAGGLANAAQWANQPAPEFGQQEPAAQQPGGRPAAAAVHLRAPRPSAAGTRGSDPARRRPRPAARRRPARGRRSIPAAERTGGRRAPTAAFSRSDGACADTRLRGWTRVGGWSPCWLGCPREGAT